MITVSEEILLLMLDYDTGRLSPKLPIRSLRSAISGALLMDLALNNRIDTDLHHLFVVNPTPLQEPVLDPILARIAADRERRPISHWLDAVAEDYEHLLEQVTDQLVARGILARGKYDLIWIMGTRRYLTEDGQPLRDVRQRIAGVLMNDEIPTSRDVMIMSLADACDLRPSLIHEPETLARYEPRIKQVATMDLIGQAVTQAIHNR
jgi:Golgi phosphoprotein 3